MADALSVYLHEQHLGTITPDRTDPKRVSLTLEDSFTPGGIQLTEAFSTAPGAKPQNEAVSNFFGGYAPEGNQRKAMADERGVEETDLFGLLREFGGSIAGAVTFRSPTEPKTYKPSYTQIEPKTVAARLRQAVEKHDLGLQDDSRSMLPGFQPKLLLARFDGEWFEPHGRAHSTHILKPELSKRPESIHNEYYSHLLARHMNLASFQSEMITIGATRFLSIERYDRRIDGDQVSLIHQEDAAQALGLDWSNSDAKFQDPKSPKREGRPSAEAVATLMVSLQTEGDPVEGWLRQLIYHVLIGNNDAHAKNIGLLHTDEGTTITQLYDAVPNLYQDGRIKWELAMSVDGDFDHRRISVEKLVAEATSWRAIPESRVIEVVSGTLETFRAALDKVKPPKRISELLVPQLHWNLDRLASGAEISEPKRGKVIAK
jgi:serine/threonine-protein kinase HipA